MAIERPFRDVVSFAVGGGWGQDHPFGDSIPVAIIRGTDFANIPAGNYFEIPRRHEKNSKVPHRLLRANDVLLEISGGSPTSHQSTGRTFFITPDILRKLGGSVIPASFCRLIRFREELVHPRYAFYSLQEMYRSGRASLYEHQSTGISNFQFEYFLDEEIIRTPPLPEQRAIAHILGTLDDKIELNRRMNETLESMARAIFKSWFVDFDPVRAKAAGKKPAGMSDEIAAMFPDSFQDSELGEIPRGWRTGTLADFSSLNPEIWSRETRPAIIKYVDLSNIKWGRIEAIAVYAQHEAPSRAQRVLRYGDTVVGTVRPGNGSYTLIHEDGLTGSTGFAVLRPEKMQYAEYVYLAATAADNIEGLSHLADGGAYPAVRPEVVASTRLVYPSGDILTRFSRITNPLIAKIAKNEHESRTLSVIRNTLLPKLISGEIRLKNAEKFLEAAHG